MVMVFVDLLAVLGQFKCPAHLAALRTLFVRYELAAVPVRRDLLIIGVSGFLGAGVHRYRKTSL